MRKKSVAGTQSPNYMAKTLSSQAKAQPATPSRLANKMPLHEDKENVGNQNDVPVTPPNGIRSVYTVGEFTPMKGGLAPNVLADVISGIRTRTKNSESKLSPFVTVRHDSPASDQGSQSSSLNYNPTEEFGTTHSPPLDITPSREITKATSGHVSSGSLKSVSLPSPSPSIHIPTPTNASPVPVRSAAKPPTPPVIPRTLQYVSQSPIRTPSSHRTPVSQRLSKTTASFTSSNDEDRSNQWTTASMPSLRHESSSDTSNVIQETKTRSPAHERYTFPMLNPHSPSIVSETDELTCLSNTIEEVFQSVCSSQMDLNDSSIQSPHPPHPQNQESSLLKNALQMRENEIGRLHSEIAHLKKMVKDRDRYSASKLEAQKFLYFHSMCLNVKMTLSASGIQCQNKRIEELYENVCRTNLPPSEWSGYLANSFAMNEDVSTLLTSSGILNHTSTTTTSSSSSTSHQSSSNVSTRQKRHSFPKTLKKSQILVHDTHSFDVAQRLITLEQDLAASRATIEEYEQMNALMRDLVFEKASVEGSMRMREADACREASEAERRRELAEHERDITHRENERLRRVLCEKAQTNIAQVAENGIEWMEMTLASIHDKMDYCNSSNIKQRQNFHSFLLDWYQQGKITLESFKSLLGESV